MPLDPTTARFSSTGTATAGEQADLAWEDGLGLPPAEDIAGEDLFVCDPETGESIPDPFSESFSISPLHAESVTRASAPSAAPAQSGTTTVSSEPTGWRAMVKSAVTWAESVVEYVEDIVGEDEPATVPAETGAESAVESSNTVTFSTADPWAEEPVCSMEDDPHAPLVTIDENGGVMVEYPDGTGVCYESRESAIADGAIEAWETGNEVYVTDLSEIEVAPPAPRRSPDASAARTAKSAPAPVMAPAEAAVSVDATPAPVQGYTFSFPSKKTEPEIPAAVTAAPETSVTATIVEAPTQPVVESALPEAAPPKALVQGATPSTAEVELADADTESAPVPVVTVQAETSVSAVSAETAENVTLTSFAGAAWLCDDAAAAGSYTIGFSEGAEFWGAHDPSHCTGCEDDSFLMFSQEDATADFAGLAVGDLPRGATHLLSTAPDDLSSVVDAGLSVAVNLSVADGAVAVFPVMSSPERRRRSPDDEDDTVGMSWYAGLLALSALHAQDAAARQSRGNQPVVYIPGGAVAAMSSGSVRGMLGALVDMGAARSDIARPVTVVARNEGEGSGERDRQGAHPDEENFIAENRARGTRPYTRQGSGVPPIQSPASADVYVTGVALV